MKAIVLTILCYAQILTGSTVVDKGIGVLSIANDEVPVLQLNIHKDRNNKSRIIANFKYEDNGNGVRSYSIEAAHRMLTDNLIEIGYEKKGIPVVEVSGAWLKVAFGSDDSGKCLTGWIESREGVTRYFSWRDHLMTKMLFFQPANGFAFYNERNGLQAEFAIRKQNDRYDYIMKPLSAEGNWMRVEVNTPSNYCNNPKEKETGVFWIRYLDDSGRPLVWYFTRGC